MISLNRTNSARHAVIGFAIAAGALTVPLSLTGCSITAPVAESGAEQNQPAVSVTITDTWAKATNPDEPLDEAMSGVFGMLENTTDGDLTIESVSSSVADVVELHEVVDGKMRKIEGDVTIPAGGSYELAPGANHIMLMDLNTDLLPGVEVPITLTFSDGSTLEFIALVKDTSGANESYGDIDMDHGEMEDGTMLDGATHEPADQSSSTSNDNS